MPPDRGDVDLAQLSKLRKYCDKTKLFATLPQIIFVTGRSQEYVESLTQILGMTTCAVELPSVIEHGAALYFPSRHAIKPLVDNNGKHTIDAIRKLLKQHYPNHAFEAKQYIITINPSEGEATPELALQIEEHLQKKDLLHDVSISTSASSVDIRPEKISKSSAVRYVVSNFFSQRPEIIAMGDSMSDLEFLLYADHAYLPANASQKLIKKISQNHLSWYHSEHYSLSSVLETVSHEILYT